MFMKIITIGINHKNTPIDIRERLFLNASQQDLLLSRLKNDPRIIEACVLSTCNRIEIYVHVLDMPFDGHVLIHHIAQIKKILFTDELYHYFYAYEGLAAIRHLFEVTAGLDSMILGEAQILGQVKSAFEQARASGVLSRHFNILSNLAVRVGKKARNETKIGFGGSSVSWAAIAKAEEIFGTLKDRSILIIGAGKMSELAVGHIQNKQFKKLYLMNRTQSNAQSLAQQFGGEAVPFCDLKEVLGEVDLCICSAGAPHYILEKGIVERVMVLRSYQPLMFVDISMPRNIDPEIKNVPHVQLYQLDDLEAVVDFNMQMREQAVIDVNNIIDQKLLEYQEKITKFDNPHILESDLTP